MKIVFFLTCCSITSLAFSQNEISGIYLTAEDFKTNTLTSSAECRPAKKSIEIQHCRHLFRSTNVFAVKTCCGIFRIQNNYRYKIINTDILPLYSRAIPVGGDGYFYEDAFFFSVKPDSEILALTKKALANSFRENKKFVKVIDSSFKNEKKLITFNKHLNKYMLVYYYEKSIE